MSAIKLTLEDGTEFEVGEVVEINPRVGVWEKVKISSFDKQEFEISLIDIADNPDRFRKLPPVREVPLTNADVLEMLRKGGYEWKLNEDWLGNSTYRELPHGGVLINRRQLSEYAAYRHTSDLIEHPMTKKEGGV